MYCYQCGAELSEEAKFCSGCGRTVDAAQPVVAGKNPRDMATHVQILAWLFIGSAVLYGMLGLALLIAPAILQNLPITPPPDVPFAIRWDLIPVATAGRISVRSRHDSTVAIYFATSWSLRWRSMTNFETPT